MTTTPESTAAAHSAPDRPRTSGRVRLVAVLVLAWIGTSLLAVRDPVLARVALLGGAALMLWLSEIVPAYVPTLLLVSGIPLLLGTTDPAYGVDAVLAWAAHPVLGLFFGGFALGLAASRHGVDEFIAERALALSHHRRRRLLALVMAATAMLSMWMSNVAAAAMMLAALRPHLHQGDRAEPFRRALLLGVAMAANLGGMASPLGTGPNAIAIASLAPWQRITFLQWMGFALPLTIGMLVLGYVLIARAHRVSGAYQAVHRSVAPTSPRARGLMAVFTVAVLAWLSEPLHGVTAPVIGLAVAAILFGGGWLGREDLGRLDWSTLFLIAGGLVLGRLIEQSGLLHALSTGVRWDAASVELRTLGFVLAAATMAAVMSNTASAALLIPLALSLGPPHFIAVLIAIGTAFGVPFTISSPPNAMAHGEGGLSSRDLLQIGVPLMLIGCLIVGLTGPHVLRALGLP